MLKEARIIVIVEAPRVAPGWGWWWGAASASPDSSLCARTMVGTLLPNAALRRVFQAWLQASNFQAQRRALEPHLDVIVIVLGVVSLQHPRDRVVVVHVCAASAVWRANEQGRARLCLGSAQGHDSVEAPRRRDGTVVPSAQSSHRPWEAGEEAARQVGRRQQGPLDTRTIQPIVDEGVVVVVVVVVDGVRHQVSKHVHRQWAWCSAWWVARSLSPVACAQRPQARTHAADRARAEQAARIALLPFMVVRCLAQLGTPTCEGRWQRWNCALRGRRALPRA